MSAFTPPPPTQDLIREFARAQDHLTNLRHLMGEAFRPLVAEALRTGGQDAAVEVIRACPCSVTRAFACDQVREYLKNVSSHIFFDCLGFATNQVFYRIPREGRDPWNWQIGYVLERGGGLECAPGEPVFEPCDGFLPRELVGHAPELPSPDTIVAEYKARLKAEGVCVNKEPVQAG